jgi:16S rRNA (adenine1518-N6/adenine1519-N6)-dimethyltransferase
MTSPKTLLKAWDIRADKRLGQNFLHDPSTAVKIVALADLRPDEIVLEIGAGLGALTVAISRRAARVYAVEKDRRLLDLLKAELLLHQATNASVLETDFLRLDLRELADRAGGRLTVMGNLPYNISSQILLRLIAQRSLLNRAILMFQKELAERLVAGPGSRAYGRLSVVLQYCAEIRPLALVEAARFFPRPKVDSQVVEIRFRSAVAHHPADEAFLFRVIKAAFGRRRKTLKNSLAGSELAIAAGELLAALGNAGIDPARRAETLSVAEFVALSECLRERMPPAG